MPLSTNGLAPSLLAPQRALFKSPTESTHCRAADDILPITQFQTEPCVLDHYDYMVNLVGVDHVAIGTDTSIGDSVGVGESVMGRPGPTPARYMNGLESPADGKNIIRGLIARGYSDEDVRKIAGENALALFRWVMG